MCRDIRFKGRSQQRVKVAKPSFVYNLIHFDSQIRKFIYRIRKHRNAWENRRMDIEQTWLPFNLQWLLFVGLTLRLLVFAADRERRQ